MPIEKAWEDSFRTFLVSGDAACIDEKSPNSHVILSQIFNQSSVGVLVVKPDDTVALMNRAAAQLFGYEPDVGQCARWTELRAMKSLYDKDSKPLNDESDPLNAALRERRRAEANVMVKTSGDEDEKWVAVTAFPVFDPEDGQSVIAGVATIIDITDFKGMQEILYHQATHDQLTGLANKSSLGAGLRKALARAKRDHSSGAVLFLDVDKFKRVNDSLGHAAGDDLIVKVADRIASEVRETDTVARVGGDEFIVLLVDIHKGDDLRVAREVAERICRSVSEPYVIWGNEVYVSISIGISVFPPHGMDEETLLQKADEAMYKVKQSGRNGWQFWGDGSDS